jgi:hypothetical protein
MVEIQGRRRQIHKGLLIDPLLGEFVQLAGAARTGTGLCESDLGIISPLNPEWHHPLPRGVTFRIAVIAESPEKPTRQASVVANRDVDLDQANRPDRPLESKDRSLVAPARIVIGENMRSPLERILHDRQFFFAHGGEEQFYDVGAVGKIFEAGGVGVQRPRLRIIRIAIDLTDPECGAIVEIGTRPGIDE